MLIRAKNIVDRSCREYWI